MGSEEYCIECYFGGGRRGILSSFPRNIHGDLHDRNIAFDLPETLLNALTVSELYDKLCGIPTSPDPDPIPREILWSLCTSAARIPSIRIFDFGEATITPDQAIKRKPGTPLMYAAPELLLEVEPEITSAIDVWVMACLATFVLHMTYFFTPPGYQGPSPVPMILHQIFLLCCTPEMDTNASGALFSALRQEAYDYPCVSKDGTVLPWATREYGTWESRMSIISRGLDDDDFAIIKKLLNRALRINPADRWTASQIHEMIPEKWRSA